MPRPHPPACRLPRRYALDVASDRVLCEDCAVGLRVQWTPLRQPLGILLGEPLLRHHIKRCPRCKRIYRYERIDMLVPPGANYAYDVVVEVGLGRFLRCRQNKRIVRLFAQEHEQKLPPGDIHHLAHAFLDGLAAVHEESCEAIATLIRRNGGWVCHLDGTCEAGSEVLFTVIDGLTGLRLDTARMPTENAKDIRKLVDRCVGRFGPPLAVMRDLSRNIESAVAHLPSSVRHFVCQYHFLENAGASLTATPHTELTRQLRKAKICPQLRSLRRDLVRYSRDTAPITPAQFEKLLEAPRSASSLDPIQLRRYVAYFLLRWLDDYSADLSGERFPFDQPSLVLHQRCAKLHDSLRRLLARHPKLSRAQPTLATVCRILAPVHDDSPLVEAARRLQKAVNLFTELREALRFQRQGRRPVRRDREPEFSMQDALEAEARLTAFRDRLDTLVKPENCPETRHDAQKVLDYLDRYWDKLFGHLLKLPEREQPVLVPRTNAICEQGFGNLKKGWRRRLGTKNLARQLQAARHEELLVANLANEQYVQAIYGGSLDNLADRFAHVAVKAQHRRCTRRDATDQHAIPVARKTLRKPHIIRRVAGMLNKLAACFA